MKSEKNRKEKLVYFSWQDDLLKNKNWLLFSLQKRSLRNKGVYVENNILYIVTLCFFFFSFKLFADYARCRCTKKTVSCKLL